MDDKEEKLERSYSFKMSVKEYKTLRDMHVNALNRGLNITIKGVIQSCIDIISQEGITDDYLKFFKKNSKNR